MYRCPECGEVFEEPVYVEGYWENYCGVASMFGDRHTVVFADCPCCGGAIDTEEDTYDEEEDDEFEE